MTFLSVCTLYVKVKFLPPGLSPQRTEDEHLLKFLVWQRMHEQPLGPSESPHLIVKQSGTLRLECDVRIQGDSLQTAHISTVSLLSQALVLLRQHFKNVTFLVYTKFNGRP